ncbi:hypothetical protein Y032_0258g449 [Ancylostoma ceylanicum]|uniref:Uncharacterized protein n=1 Tax=Ancylostoma ceylanicum TaxID=53326 RepID=A0A016SBJ4_9BILA|nr:hypothetical protein Y032_0258g449 [Ancylostoma ceylanicum]
MHLFLHEVGWLPTEAQGLLLIGDPQMVILADQVDFAEMSPPLRISSRSSPVRIRKKFPESWIFISLNSECVAYNYSKV